MVYFIWGAGTLKVASSGLSTQEIMRWRIGYANLYLSGSTADHCRSTLRVLQVYVYFQKLYCHQLLNLKLLIFSCMRNYRSSICMLIPVVFFLLYDTNH